MEFLKYFGSKLINLVFATSCGILDDDSTFGSYFLGVVLNFAIYYIQGFCIATFHTYVLPYLKKISKRHKRKIRYPSAYIRLEKELGLRPGTFHELSELYDECN